jgi:hypothetical protein
MLLRNFRYIPEDRTHHNHRYENLNSYKLHLILEWPLWSTGQSSWLQVQRSGFDSRRYQIFREVVSLKWGSTHPREYN